MDKLKIYLIVFLTALFSVSASAFSVRSAKAVSQSISASAFLPDDGSFDEDYESITTEHDDIFSYNSFTNSKRHVRTNVRRKQSSSSIAVFSSSAYVLTHKAGMRRAYFCAADAKKPLARDYVVLLRRIII